MISKPNLKNPIHLLAFGFGSGLAATAPGTAGTLAAIIPWLWLSQLELGAYLLVILLASIAGIFICDQTSRDLGVHDHGGIVWDEFCGLWITLIAVPLIWYWVVIGFLLFRFFDILKPWPISWLDQKVSGGFGIMIDDLLAGLFAWIVLQTLIYCFQGNGFQGNGFQGNWLAQMVAG